MYVYRYHVKLFTGLIYFAHLAHLEPYTGRVALFTDRTASTVKVVRKMFVFYCLLEFKFEIHARVAKFTILTMTSREKLGHSLTLEFRI